MGMYDNLNDIVKTLYNDETLLRLLYYPPSNFSTIKDPLDDSLPNILDTDEDWSIRDERIIPRYKSMDLENNELCRINVYAGNRTSTNHNYQMANQDIIIDVFTHDFFERDIRSLRISDRLNEILIHTRTTGVTKIRYEEGRRIEAPNQYSGYRHFYSFESAKK
jgi:hypothetical protein